ncbi:MAG: hypothetical protein J0I65_07745 [Variovorax sp.]|nr:hypothetical protein [Variovorax sp.]
MDTFVCGQQNHRPNAEKWWANVRNRRNDVTDFSLILRSENKKAGNDVLPA